MILRFIAAALLMTFCSSGIGQTEESDQSWEEQVAAATLNNNTMSDEALLNYLEDMYQYMPELFEELVNQDPDALTESLNNVRNHHSRQGISIIVLIEWFEQSPEWQEMMAQTWAEDTLGYEYAVNVLEGGLTTEQQSSILDTCIPLIKGHSSRKSEHFSEDFPKALSFLSIKLLSVSQNSCSIYLYNGIGSYKRAGFMVSGTKDGRWSLSQFNYMQSMEHQQITVID